MWKEIKWEIYFLEIPIYMIITFASHSKLGQEE